MDHRFARLSALIASAVGDKDAKASDYIPDYRRAEVVRTGELRPEEIQMLNVLLPRAKQ